VTFASSSSVHGLLASIEARELPPVIASIGPATTATLVGRGLEVDGRGADAHDGGPA
jgi:uroporphyrinogen-III synthase